jgi:hypothetical protein
MRFQANHAMSQVYASGEVKRARWLFENLARRLERNYPSAAASLREGLDAHRDATRPPGESRTRAVLDQPDREPARRQNLTRHRALMIPLWIVELMIEDRPPK